MSDFMSKLKQAAGQHLSAKTTGTKRRRFVPGLEIVGRLLPYIHANTGDIRFTEQHFNHYYLGAIDGKWNFLTCPKQGTGVQVNWDAACPFCDAMLARYKDLGHADNTYSNYKRKKKIKVNFYLSAVNVMTGYTVDDADKEVWVAEIGKIIVLDMPPSINDKIEAAMTDPDLGQSIFSPEDGFDFRVKCTTKTKGKGSNEPMADYSLSDFARKATSICDPGGAEAFIQGCTDIGEQLRLLSVADIGRVTKAAEDEGLIASDNPLSKADTAPADTQSTSKPEAKEGSGSISDIFAMYMENGGGN